MKDLPGVVRAAAARAGLGAGTTVLAAVSGGPDSTAMLRALVSAAGPRGFRVVAGVIDHGIRPSAEVLADVSFLRDLCATLGVPLLVSSVPPGELARRARSRHASLEETARDVRLSLLAQAARDAGADVIALGHTQDDAIETLLMRLLQGSDVHGLRGIAVRRGPFFRPLLECSRRQVLDYLRALGQDWREDPSNRDPAMLRNRIRHRLVPVLEEVVPGFRRGLAVLPRKLELSSDLARRLSASLPWTAAGGGFSIDAASFFAAHPAVRAASLLQLYDRFRPADGARRLPWRFLEPALRRRPGEGTILRGHEVRLEERGGALSWGPDIASRTKKGYFIVVSEARSAEIRETGVRVSLTSGPRGGCRGGIVILAAKVKPPFVLRSKRRGDHIRLPGGTTSVKELLIGMKVPKADRDLVPILSDGSGVLAVLGGPLGYRTRARAGTLAPEGGTGDCIEVLVQGEQGRGT